MKLPSSTITEVADKVSAAGTPYRDALLLVDDQGLPWSATLLSPTPTWSFAAVPSCQDIATVYFSRCDDLVNAVATCAQLRTWGF